MVSVIVVCAVPFSSPSFTTNRNLFLFFLTAFFSKSYLSKRLGPHMENIEQALHETKKNYNAFQLNMDLLSNMYKDSLKNLEAMKCSMNDVTRERDSMGKKMSILVKKLQIEKQENIRKDKLIKKILAAKHAGTAALNESMEELNEATEKAEVSDAAIEISPILHVHTIQSHDVRLILNCNPNLNFACVSPPSMHTFIELTLMLVLKNQDS